MNPILAQFILSATPIMDFAFAQDRCINATRVTIDVLRKFHIKAKPLSVECTAVNGKCAELLIKYGHLPQTDEETEQWWGQGAFVFKIDTGPARPGHWNGHVVTIANGHIIDAAVGQFNRPDKSLLIPESILVAPLRPGFFAGKSMILGADHTDARLIYTPRPDDKSFIKASGFERHEGNVRVTEEIVRDMIRKLWKPSKT